MSSEKKKKDFTEQKPSLLPWYRKSAWLLSFLIFLLIVSIGLFVGLAFTTLPLVFIVVPIVLLVSAIFIGIKIAYDNRISRSAIAKIGVKKEVSENPVSTPSPVASSQFEILTTQDPPLPITNEVTRQEKQEEPKNEILHAQDNVENKENDDLSEEIEQKNIIVEKSKKIILQFGDGTKEIFVPLNELDKIWEIDEFTDEFIAAHIPKCYEPFRKNLISEDADGNRIFKISNNQDELILKLKLAFWFDIKFQRKQPDISFEIPVKKDPSVDEVDAKKVGYFLLRKIFNAFEMIPQKIEFYLGGQSIELDRLVFNRTASQIYIKIPDVRNLGPHASDRQWCENIPYKAPLLNEDFISGLKNFTTYQQEIFKVSKIPPEKQKILIFCEKEKIELTEENFSSVVEKNIDDIQVFLAPPKKTTIYWSDSLSADPMQRKVFKDFNAAIKYLESGSDREIYAIEVDETSLVSSIPIQNDPAYVLLANKDKEKNQEYLLFSRSIGAVKLTQNVAKFEPTYWFNFYDAFAHEDRIHETLADYNLNQWLKKESIDFFCQTEEGKMRLNDQFKCFFEYIPLISQLDKNELDALVKDLFSLTPGVLLDKYAKSKKIAFIIKRYYMNPLSEKENPLPPEWYRAGIRYLIQSYNNIIQENHIVDFDEKNINENVPKGALCARYFNSNNDEIFNEKEADHLEGIDFKTGTYFYETIGKRSTQEDAMVSDRLSASAVSAYRTLSLEQKKQLMARVCQKAQEKYGQNSEQGSCAVFAFLFGKEIIASSLGDSVIFLVIRNPDKSVASIRLLSANHGVDYISDEEVERIKMSLGPDYKRGKRMGRGGVNISRAFGDLGQEGLSHEPVIQQALSNSYEIPEGGDAFVLFACDGFWEGWPGYDSEISHINYVEKFITFLTRIFEQENIKAAPPSDIPRLLASSAIVDFNSGDNLSIMLKRIEDPFLSEENPKSSSQEEQDIPLDFLGLLDGHAGKKVSSTIAEHIVEIIEEALALILKSIESESRVTTAFPSPLSSIPIFAAELTGDKKKQEISTDNSTNTPTKS